MEIADVQILKSDNHSTITLLLGNNTEKYHILIGTQKLIATSGKFVINNPTYDDQNRVFVEVFSASFGDRLLRGIAARQSKSWYFPCGLV